MNKREKLVAILDYWLEHNREHLRENDKWRSISYELGYENAAREFERIADMMEESIRRIEHVRRDFEESGAGHPAKREGGTHAGDAYGERERTHDDGASLHRHIELHQIGVIRTPYPPGSTWEQMQEQRKGCRIIVDDRYKEGLYRLGRFRYVIVLFYLDRAQGRLSLYASPPASPGLTVGVFASRSPNRPNPVGLCITELRGIAENVVKTGRIDAYDGTPLIDLKPYIERSDSIPGAQNGWLDDAGR